MFCQNLTLNDNSSIYPLMLMTILSLYSWTLNLMLLWFLAKLGRSSIHPITGCMKNAPGIPINVSGIINCIIKFNYLIIDPIVMLLKNRPIYCVLTGSQKMLDYLFNIIYNRDSKMLDHSSNLNCNQISSYLHMMHRRRARRREPRGTIPHSTSLKGTWSAESVFKRTRNSCGPIYLHIGKPDLELKESRTKRCFS